MPIAILVFAELSNTTNKPGNERVCLRATASFHAFRETSIS